MKEMFEALIFCALTALLTVGLIVSVKRTIETPAENVALDHRVTFIERGLRLETSYESHGIQTYRVYKGNKFVGVAANKGACWNYGKNDGEWRHEGPRAPISDAAMWIEYWGRGK